MDNKPIVMFHCDVPGWAYHNRAVRLLRAMPNYEVRALLRENMPHSLACLITNRADILVAQGIKTIRRMADVKGMHIDGADNLGKVMRRKFDNIVVRFDSVRVDLHGFYYDIWTGKQI